MHIYGPAHLHGPQSIGAPHTSRISPPATRGDSAPIRDELQISDAARLVEQAQQAPDIRQDRVNAIRANRQRHLRNGRQARPGRLPVAG